MAANRSVRWQQVEGWALARQAMSGLWQLARTRQALERGLAEESRQRIESPMPVETLGLCRSLRAARLARINGTLAEINEQIEETLSAVNLEEPYTTNARAGYLLISAEASQQTIRLTAP